MGDGEKKSYEMRESKEQTLREVILLQLFSFVFKNIFENGNI